MAAAILIAVGLGLIAFIIGINTQNMVGAITAIMLIMYACLRSFALYRRTKTKRDRYVFLLKKRTYQLNHAVGGVKNTIAFKKSGATKYRMNTAPQLLVQRSANSP